MFKYRVRKTEFGTFEAIITSDDGFRIAWRCLKYPTFKDYYLMMNAATKSYFSNFLPKKYELQKIKKDMGY